MATTYTATQFTFKIGTRTFGCLGAFEFSSNTEENESTCVASGSQRDYEPGLTDATLSGSGAIRKIGSGETTEIGAFELLTIKDAGTVSNFAFGGFATGDDVITGTFFFTNVTLGRPQTGNTTFSFTGRVKNYTVAKVAAPVTP